MNDFEDFIFGKPKQTTVYIIGPSPPCPRPRHPRTSYRKEYQPEYQPKTLPEKQPKPSAPEQYIRCTCCRDNAKLTGRKVRYKNTMVEGLQNNTMSYKTFNKNQDQCDVCHAVECKDCGDHFQRRSSTSPKYCKFCVRDKRKGQHVRPRGSGNINSHGHKRLVRDSGNSHGHKRLVPGCEKTLARTDQRDAPKRCHKKNKNAFHRYKVYFEWKQGVRTVWIYIKDRNGLYRKQYEAKIQKTKQSSTKTVVEIETRDPNMPESKSKMYWKTEVLTETYYGKQKSGWGKITDCYRICHQDSF